MQDTRRLRELAAWYREIAERAGSPWVWEARLNRAEDLERQAADLDARSGGGAHAPTIYAPATTGAVTPPTRPASHRRGSPG